MKLFWSFLCLTATLYSCNRGENPLFEFSGGSIHIALDNEPATFISRNVDDIYSADVLSQVMEGLVSLDPKDLTVMPRIAKSWKISPDGLTYEFRIRNDILFHPHDVFVSDEDRILTVNDVKKTIELICSKGETGLAGTAYAFVFEQYLEGAQDFFENKKDNINGLTIKGDKVIFKLTEKDNNFLCKLSNISCAINSSKIQEAHLEQDMIGTGPFKYREYRKGSTNSIILIKNEDYYLADEKGCSLPYLDSVIYVLENRKLEQLSLFEEKKLDLICGLPASRIAKMLEGRISDFNSSPPLLMLQNNPILTTNYYFFNMDDKRFKNVKVRQAFNYAVDREKIGSDVLRNQYSELGYYGIVPPIASTLRGYDFEGIKAVSYSFNPDKAKKLLAEAGYPGGAGFGSINLRFNISDINSGVAEEFANQIFSVLGINVNIDGSTFDQLQRDANSGKGELFRTGWVADYPSPETFLFNFYAKSVLLKKSTAFTFNMSKYNNPEFDKLFELAKRSTKLSDQMNYFSQAEKVLIADPPIIPLWYTGDYEIVHSEVRNLYFNALNQLVFTRVYKKPWTKEEYLEKMKHEK